MPHSLIIDDQSIQGLFENRIFTTKLRQFIDNSPQGSPKYPEEKVKSEIDSVSEEISNLILQAMSRETGKELDVIAEEMNKINAQITNLKNTVFGCNEKVDLETTYYNKSRLEISSILQQDIGCDFGDVKSSIVEIQQRFNEWFGGKISSEMLSSADNLNESKLSQFITKKCADHVQSTEKKILKRLQATDLMADRRIEQISRTLNNVLQMLNEVNKNKNGSKQQIETQQAKPAITSNQPSLIRQSSLQNLKIKSFFNFGHK